METITSIQGDTVDLICWRHYGAGEGFVEQVLQANPGVASLGAVLPIGTVLRLPDVPKQAKLPTVSLWS